MTYLKKMKLGACALVTACVLGTVPVEQPPIASAATLTKAEFVAKFKDTKGHWAEDVLYQAYTREIVKGDSETSMNPDGLITHAEYAAMLSRVTKQQPSESVPNPFPDAKTGWFADDVQKLVSLEFIDPKDYASGFKPSAKLTRKELIKWLSTGLSKSSETFAEALKDTQNTLLPFAETYKDGIASEMIPYVALTLGTGVVGGFEDHTIRLKNTTTRAEVASMLLNYANVEGQKADNYKALSELREVGKTGSNVLTMTPYTYINKHDFSHLRDKPITFSNRKGEYKVKRVIFVDLDRIQGSGVYAPMFIDYKNPRYSRFYKEIQGKFYGVFIEMTVTAHIDKMKDETFGNGLLNTGFRRLSAISWENNKLKEFGYPTYPTYWNLLIGDDPTQFFKKGIAKVLWMEDSIEKVEMHDRAYQVRTASGEEVGIELKKAK